MQCPQNIHFVVHIELSETPTTHRFSLHEAFCTTRRLTSLIRSLKTQKKYHYLALGIYVLFFVLEGATYSFVKIDFGYRVS